MGSCDLAIDSTNGAIMRPGLDPDSENLFERKQQEKDAQGEAMFAKSNAYSAEFKSYVRQQIIEKPRRISVGKPAFAACRFQLPWQVFIGATA